MIEIRNISKWYGSTQVLKNCSTNVAKGEVVVVCGPSGCQIASNRDPHFASNDDPLAV